MKMFFIVYAAYFDERITDTLKKAGYKAYTKMHDVTGEGEESEPKLGTSYSPGKNKTIWMAISEDKVKNLIELIRKIKAEHPGAGLRVFTFPLAEEKV
jgi:nitrogen regulatory protein PII